MKQLDEQRIDKWLWTVRIYKTRSLATDECRKGKVLINSEPVKPSRSIKPGDIVFVRKMPVIYSYRILAIPPSRLPAREVENHAEDLTPEEELKKLDFDKFASVLRREKGTGRPTKKDRRSIDELRKRGKE